MIHKECYPLTEKVCTILFSFAVLALKAVSYAIHKQVFPIQGETGDFQVSP